MFNSNAGYRLPPFYNVTSNILVEGVTVKWSKQTSTIPHSHQMAALRSCDSYKTLYNQLLKAV